MIPSRSLICATWLMAVAQSAPVGAQQRDSIITKPATATIRGRVTSAAGRPLHRVRITLNGGVANPPATVTDTLGQFELLDVPPGSYSITATRAGYLTLQYGQRRPREAGRPLTVKPGETIGGIDIALPKGGMITGRVDDELGDPLPGARVEAVELRYIRGRRVAVPARIATTNDVGEYLLGGLEPGGYQVRASTIDVWEADDGKQTHTYAVTYFPGVTAREPPQTIEVNIGQEVGGIDMRLVAGPAATITGIVEDASGAPTEGATVNLSRATRTVGGALMSTQGAGSTRTDARGMFEFQKLAAGEYIAHSGGQSDTASVPVMLHEGDSRHVVLTPRKASAVIGSVVTDDGKSPTFIPARMRVVPVSADPESLLPSFTGAREQTVAVDWTFKIVNVDGPYLFRAAGLPDDWMLRAVMFGGRDVTDTPLAVPRGGPDAEGLQIVVSRNGAQVTGDVVDQSGSPTGDVTVVLFAADSALWTTSSRFIKATRPDRAGRFSIGGMPAGTYLIVAKDFVIEGQWEDPAFLQTVSHAAARVELKEAAVENVKVIAEPVQ
jgi:hypothetical protein